MYHQDWLMRQIENLVRMVSRLVFKRDFLNYEVSHDSIYLDSDLIYKEILELVNILNINEAENLLFDSLENTNLDYLSIGLDFYDRLNSLSDEDLEKGNFTRKEIREGLDDLLEFYKISIPEILK